MAYDEPIKFDMVRPCDQCPFLAVGGVRLPQWRRQSIADSITKEDTCFPCHKTLDYELERPYMDEHTQQCAGALIVLAKSGLLYDSLYFRMAVLLGKFDPNGLDMSAPTAESLDQFVKHVSRET